MTPEQKKSLQTARALMNQDAWDNLNKIVMPSDNTLLDNNKNVINNDVLMAAYCKAIKDEVIESTVLSKNPMLIKLYNSQTNKLSDWKVEKILQNIHTVQPNIACVITIQNGNLDTIKEFIYTDHVHFHELFKWVVTHFKITPQLVRQEMVKKLDIPLSTTNNIGQDLSKVDDPDASVSIITISRLVNMCNHIIKAEFKEINK